MPAQGVYKITEDFEKALAEYTGAPYAVAVDSCSSAIFLSLMYQQKYYSRDKVYLPCRTFPSVPCEVLHAELRIEFYDGFAQGAYQLEPFNVYDAALRFTHNMYIPDSHMCLSFTGPKKHLKLIKGGAILTDDMVAAEWFKSARMSGRHECDFMKDTIEFAGWNCYMMPEVAARGLMLMRQFYDDEGKPKDMPDVVCEYPDLSQMPAFKGARQ